jgi:hypothetical protein
MSHEHKIKASVRRGLFYCHDVSWGLNNAQHRIISLGVAADFTDTQFSEVPAPLTTLYFFQSCQQRISQELCRLTITLE